MKQVLLSLNYHRDVMIKPQHTLLIIISNCYVDSIGKQWNKSKSSGLEPSRVERVWGGIVSIVLLGSSLKQSASPCGHLGV